MNIPVAHIQAGEEEHRIDITGAPQLDELLQGDLVSPEEIASTLTVNLGEPLVLVLQHPVTEEFGHDDDQMRETLDSVCDLGLLTITIFPNCDAGSDGMCVMIERYHRPFMQVEPANRAAASAPRR